MADFLESYLASLTSPVQPPTEETLKAASQLLRQGQVVAFPTETVYGLGANALSEEAVKLIYTMKGRPSHNPLIVHVANKEAASEIALEWSDLAETLATHFWPGPLTLVLKRNHTIASIVSAGLHTVAVRVPAHPAALKLLNLTGLPIAAPSANRSERTSPTHPSHVLRGLPDLQLIIDGGPCHLGIESTVIDLTCSQPRLLRAGALPVAALLKFIPELVLQVGIADDQSPKSSPGMMQRHYAPKAKMILVGDLENFNFSSLEQPFGVITYGCFANEMVGAKIEMLPSNPAGYAADLYAAIHRLDDQKVGAIIARIPPVGNEWLAIHDRLNRMTAG